MKLSAWPALCAALLLAALIPAHAATDSDRAVRHHTVDVDGMRIFYREAGAADAPVVLLLHGFPASSFMFRNLLVELADDFRVIAPDYPGFGHSDAPSPKEFAYTFDRLADVIEGFTTKLGLRAYALYMQDFGGPVGFRLATRRPHAVTHLVIQNANAYEEGLPDDFWAPARALWKNPTRANFEKLRRLAMSDDALEWNYTHGVGDAARIDPDSWTLQKALLARPGNQDAMLALLYDYRSNLPLYPRWQEYFRTHRPPTLIAWGRNDVIFPEPGARAYLEDLPQAELHVLDTGHFALEEKGAQIARLMRDFLRRAPAR
jgi:pimeloyl-ACP methyl ester carboxylesterase